MNNKSIAESQINRNAGPVEFSNGFFSAKIKLDPLGEANKFNIQHEDEFKYSRTYGPHARAFNYEEERQVNLEDVDQVRQRLDEYDEVVNSLQDTVFYDDFRQLRQAQPVKEPSPFKRMNDQPEDFERKRFQPDSISGPNSDDQGGKTQPAIGSEFFTQAQLAPGFHDLNPADTIDEVVMTHRSDTFFKMKNQFLSRLSNVKRGHLNDEDIDKIIDPKYREYVQRVLNFNEIAATLPMDIANSVNIVYIPSGAGKSTLKKQAVQIKNSLIDIDDFIAERYKHFQVFEELMRHDKSPHFLMKWFKYEIFQSIDQLRGKIFLCNHPNQLPNQVRNFKNEIIILPTKHNWGLRFFDDNLFSLMGVTGKRKILARYDSYEHVIIDSFNQ